MVNRTMKPNLSLVSDQVKPNFKPKANQLLVTCLTVYVVTWCLSKVFDAAQTVGQLVFLIVPMTLVIMYYVELITVDETGVRYHHDKLQG